MDDGSEERIAQVRELLVTPGQMPERIDSFITKGVLRATRNRVQRAIDAGAVLVNGKPTRSNYKVRPGDRIEITLMKPRPIELIAQDIPLEIAYEDDDLLIVNKPAGMVTHPGYGNRDGTLVNAVLHHVGGSLPIVADLADEEEDEIEELDEEVEEVDEEMDESEDGVGDLEEEMDESDDEVEDLDEEVDESEEEVGDLGDEVGELEEVVADLDEAGDELQEEVEEDEGISYNAIRPGIVHRLDKETSGLMVVAKNADALSGLARQFADRTAKREYWAVTWGVFKEDEGEIEGDIGRDPRDRRRFVVTRRGGKYALTRYRVIERFEFMTLVALRLATGRTHQIRVHCAHIGRPLFGDPTYGGRNVVYPGAGGKHRTRIANLLTIMNRQALHAKMLGIVQPRTHELLQFDSELPEDMMRLVEKLRE